MKATELRIGNWVLIPYQNAPIAIPAHETKVQGITIFGEVLTDNTPEHEGLKTHFNHVSGIPINELWLEKLGFKSIGLQGQVFEYLIDEHNRFTIETDCKFFYPSLNYDFCCLYQIKYVHQIQNLYHALTGKELIPNTTLKNK